MVPVPRSTFHRHNEIEITLVERGQIVDLIGGRRQELHEGQLAVFWGGVPHLPLSCASGTILHWLTIPLTWFLQWRLPAAFVGPLLRGRVFSCRPGQIEVEMNQRSFERWHADLRVSSEERRRLVLLECEARLRRWLIEEATTVKQQAREPAWGGGEAGRVETMAAFIAQHYTEPLTVAEIARAARLHPDYAGALFRRTCGLGIVDYITEHRVSHAQRLLATSDAKMLEIAFASGFGSASRFYAAFVRNSRQTPRTYRQSVRQLQ